MNQNPLDPGGVTDISRGLRSNATTPPDQDKTKFCIPEGCQMKEFQVPKNTTHISHSQHRASVFE